MEVNRKDLRVTINEEEWLVDLKWYRGPAVIIMVALASETNTI